MLMRRLKGRARSPTCSASGREWLVAELPVEESETVEAALRQIEFLDTEIAAVEQLIAQHTLKSADARRC